MKWSSLHACPSRTPYKSKKNPWLGVQRGLQETLSTASAIHCQVSWTREGMVGSLKETRKDSRLGLMFEDDGPEQRIIFFDENPCRA